MVSGACLPGRQGRHPVGDAGARRLLGAALCALVLAAGLLTAPAARAQNWDGIVPPGLEPGDKYRILYIDGPFTPSDRSKNHQWDLAARAGLADGELKTALMARFGRLEIDTLLSEGKGSNVTAKQNTSTTGSGTGISIWWYKGPKAADSYNDFYDGNWDNNGLWGDLGIDGSALCSSNPKILTGSYFTGTAAGSNWSIDGGSGREAYGLPCSKGKELNAGGINPNTGKPNGWTDPTGTNNIVYVLTSVFTVPGFIIEAADDAAFDSQGRLSVREGGKSSFTVRPAAEPVNFIDVVLSPAELIVSPADSRSFSTS